jgi:hypothetical protein
VTLSPNGLTIVLELAVRRPGSERRDAFSCNLSKNSSQLQLGLRRAGYLPVSPGNQLNLFGVLRWNSCAPEKGRFNPP